MEGYGRLWNVIEGLQKAVTKQSQKWNVMEGHRMSWKVTESSHKAVTERSHKAVAKEVTKEVTEKIYIANSNRNCYIYSCSLSTRITDPS